MKTYQITYNKTRKPVWTLDDAHAVMPMQSYAGIGPVHPPQKTVVRVEAPNKDAAKVMLGITIHFEHAGRVTEWDALVFDALRNIESIVEVSAD